MKTPTTWLRVSYWVGAVSDGIVAVMMYAQAFFVVSSPLTHHHPDVAYRYAMCLAASLMLGWTILLVWADRKPIERRGILLITNVVIIGLIGSGLLAVSTGFLPVASMVPLAVFQVGLIALFTASYAVSSKKDNPLDAAGKGARKSPASAARRWK